jgi:hypothetical protein|tara:strand:+ start:924 stop:1115 length:192 start_codon:yes stop_codon:yes gene_type:complete
MTDRCLICEDTEADAGGLNRYDFPGFAEPVVLCEACCQTVEEQRREDDLESRAASKVLFLTLS